MICERICQPYVIWNMILKILLFSDVVLYYSLLSSRSFMPFSKHMMIDATLFASLSVLLRTWFTQRHMLLYWRKHTTQINTVIRYCKLNKHSTILQPGIPKNLMSLCENEVVSTRHKSSVPCVPQIYCFFFYFFFAQITWPNL